MIKGFVYILGNDAMPGLYKIGKTTRSVEARAAELFQTGVPQPFEILHTVYAPDCHRLEADMHSIFADERLDMSREFFMVDLDLACRQMDALLADQVSALIDEFMPDHVAVRSEMVVDEATICLIANELNEHPVIVAAAFSQLKPEEVADAVDRERARMQAAKVVHQ